MLGVWSHFLVGFAVNGSVLKFGNFQSRSLMFYDGLVFGMIFWVAGVDLHVKISVFFRVNVAIFNHRSLVTYD